MRAPVSRSAIGREAGPADFGQHLLDDFTNQGLRNLHELALGLLVSGLRASRLSCGEISHLRGISVDGLRSRRRRFIL